MIKNLTTGSPTKKILIFSLPLLLTTALQQVYNMAGSVIVGQVTGRPGLAAIGAAYPVILILLAIATGSSMGCSVTISQLYGAGRIREMKSAIYTALISLSALGALLGAAGILLAEPLMRMLNVSEELLPEASGYLAVYCAGVLPMFVYNAVNAAYTGLGDSRYPLYILIVSSVLNVLLALAAVGPLGMGVAGAAWSAFFAQLAAAVFACVSLLRRLKTVRTDDKVSFFDRSLLLLMSRVAVPSILQQACVAFAHTLVQSLVNTYPTAVIAGYEAASKTQNFAYMSLNTLGTALSAFAAQNHGAQKHERIKKGYIASTAICLALTALVVLILQVFPGALIGLYVDSGAEPVVMEVGIRFLRIVSPAYFIICFIITAGGLLRGTGRVGTFLGLTVIDFTVRVSMCYFLTWALGSYTGLFWAWYFGAGVEAVLLIIIFARSRLSSAPQPRLLPPKEVFRYDT